jgi:hypothetical protein
MVSGCALTCQLITFLLKYRVIISNVAILKTHFTKLFSYSYIDLCKKSFVPPPHPFHFIFLLHRPYVLQKLLPRVLTEQDSTQANLQLNTQHSAELKQGQNTSFGQQDRK